MNVKITFFLESVQAATKYSSAALGWTETIYGFSPLFASLDQWLESPQVAQYIKYRRNCMTNNYRIAWVRVSEEGNPRSFKIMAVDKGYGTAATSSTTEGRPIGLRGQVNCALLVDLAKLPEGPTDHTHHRRFLMRALPVDIIDGNVVNLRGPNWLNVFYFLTWLAGPESGNPLAGLPDGDLRVGIMGLKYQDPAASAYVASPAVINAPGSPRMIEVAANLPGVPLRSEYTFRDFPDSIRALNRTWRLLATTAGPPGLSLLGRTKRDLPPVNYTVPGPGRIRLVVPKYAAFDQFTIIGLRNKKTGRLFRQLRGRSSNR